MELVWFVKPNITGYGRFMDDRSDKPLNEERASAGVQVREGFAQLIRWAGRPEVHRYLIGTSPDLTPTDAALLEYFSRNGPVRLSDLAARQRVDKSTITPQVRRLEEKGLVQRSADPRDGRATLLSISVQGREIQRRIRIAGAGIFDEILSTWTPADREALGSLLVRFSEQLVQHDPLQHRTSATTPNTENPR